MADLQIDHLNLENYSNLEAWVSTLNERIDIVFGERLIHAVDAWCAEFSKGNNDHSNGNAKPTPADAKVSDTALLA
jgi:hypothetical protein